MEYCCLVTKLFLTLATPWTVAHQAPSIHGISKAIMTSDVQITPPLWQKVKRN